MCGVCIHHRPVLRRPVSILLPALLVVMSFCGCGRADAQKLRVGLHADFPPFEYMDGERICGIDPEIAQEIARELGRELELVEHSLDYLFTALETDKIDLAVSAAEITAERQSGADFSESYAESELVIAVMRDSPVRNVRDLRTRLIGVRRGSMADDYVTRHIRVPVRFSGLADAMQNLRNGLVDAVVAQRTTLAVLQQVQKDLKILEPGLARRACAIAVRKGNDDLRQAVNRVLRRMKTSGRLTEIRRRAVRRSAEMVFRHMRQKKKLHAAVFASVPPYSFIRDGKAVGIEPAILKHIADELSMTLVTEPAGFDVLFEMVAEKNGIDIGAGLISCFREQNSRIVFSIPYFSSRLCLYVPERSPVTGLEQARGRRIGAVYGTSSEQYVRRHIGVPECYTGQVLMFRALAAGELDAIVTEQYAGDYFSRKYPRIRRLAAPLQEEKYVFAVRKGAPELQENINRILYRLQEDGTIRRIVEQYYREYQP